MPLNIRDVHQSVSSELEELAAAFALETLEIDEGDAYRDHLRACPVCRGLLGEFQTVVNILPVALDVTTTRSELKDRILAEAMADFESEFTRSEEHTSELQSQAYLVCRLLLEKKK